MALDAVRWQSIKRWVGWACVVVPVAVGLIYLSVWYGPDLIAKHDLSGIARQLRAVHLQAAREAARTQVLTLVAGLFAAGAFVYQGRNRRLERRTFGLAQQGQVTDRYAKAIEELGSSNLAVRVGGVYALERIARDSARDHPTIVAVLAAFIREQSIEQRPSRGAESGQVAHKTGPDVLAAATVIARRDHSHDREPLDLSGADLRGAKLPNAALAGADLSKAVLSGANLSAADLTGANLKGARLDGADLRHARLDDATMSGFPKSVIGRRVLLGAGQTIPDPVTLAGAKLSHATCVEANLAGADLRNAELNNADMTEADLSYATLNGASLDHAGLPRAILADADLSEVMATFSSLAGASVMRADLSASHFSVADLSGADLREANLDADLSGSDFDGADLSGTDLTRANINQSTFKSTKLDGTLWPPDVPVPPGWSLDPGSGRLSPLKAKK